MDDREREKFYSASEANPDDEEYELEPPDATVVSAEDRHGKEVSESARLSIDIDEVYREADRNRGAEILEQWVRNFQFRFQVKHLLIATAVLAIALTLAKLGIFWPTLVLLLMLSIAGLYSYLKWEERKQQAEADRKRQELYARRREQLKAKHAAPAAGAQNEPREATPVPPALPPNEVDEIWQEAVTREPFRFHFSLRQLILAMTAAAVILGMIRILGGPAPTATILGFVAMSGLIVHALGFEPPQSVILGWWLILVLYVLLSIFAAVWSSVA